MKKLFTFLLALTFVMFISNANAQLGYGLLGGLNFGNVYGDDAERGGEDPCSLLGFTGGSFLSAGMGKGLNFRAELLWGQKGAKYEYDEIDTEVRVKIDYLDMPVLIQYCILTEGSIVPFIIGGGYLGLRMSATVETEIAGETNEEDHTDEAKSVDYGIIFGAGILINDLFELSARYGLGLTTVDDSDDEMDMKNKVIQILAGIHL